MIASCPSGKRTSSGCHADVSMQFSGSLPSRCNLHSGRVAGVEEPVEEGAVLSEPDDPKNELFLRLTPPDNEDEDDDEEEVEAASS